MTSYNPFSLVGKNILVTGGSSGIGRGVAIECSRMGASVIITGRNKERLDNTFAQLEGNNNKEIIADLRRKDDKDLLVSSIPMLDGVVHCAGIGDKTLCKTVKEEDLERVMSINFNSPVLLQARLLKGKKISPSSSIVFIASRAPFAPTIGNGLYSASKGALIAYAKVLSLELAPRGIRVNSICPAMVWTELIEKDSILTGVDYHEAEKKYPLKRYGNPKDVACLAVYLLSDASSWMTGSCIDITGGAYSL